MKLNAIVFALGLSLTTSIWAEETKSKPENRFEQVVQALAQAEIAENSVERQRVWQELETLANQGDFEAQSYLASFYEYDSEKGDIQKAIYWLEQIAKQSSNPLYPAAQKLGALYAKGAKGLAADKQKALAWYQRSLARGEMESDTYLFLAKAYLSGEGVAKDEATATEFLTKAMESGSSEACWLLAERSENTPQRNDEEIYQLYSCASVAHPEAAFKIAEMWEKGRAGAQVSIVDIMQEYNRIVSTADVPQALKDKAEAKIQALLPQLQAFVNNAEIEQGRIEAMSLLGNLYEYGVGVSKDYREALNWYRDAYQAQPSTPNGDLSTFNQLDNLRKRITDINRPVKIVEANEAELAQLTQAETLAKAGDFAGACKIWKPLAEKGIARAQYEFAMGLDCGLADQASVEMVEKAARQNFVPAQVELAYFYQNGVGVPADWHLASMWLEKAAKNGDAKADYQLGDNYSDGIGVAQDYSLAAAYYQKAIEGGVVAANNDLGYLYDLGLINGTADHALAFKHYQLAAEAGESIAMSNIGVQYINGEGVKKDYHKAKEWFEKAIHTDNQPRAKYHLARLYHHGWGVKKDMVEAANWYQQAAEEASEFEAAFALARLYEAGEGVRKDRDKAIELYNQALEFGDEEYAEQAQQALERLVK